MSDIQPEIGRCLHYYPSTGDAVTLCDANTPFAATIVFVTSERIVSVAGFDHIGRLFNKTNIQLVQPGDPIPDRSVGYCTWMPYQIENN